MPANFTNPMPSDFNVLASAAASRGRPAIPALMLGARDGRTLRAQLCAIKALGMLSHTTASEALRRISQLELDGDRGRVLRAALPDLLAYELPWDADLVIASLLRDDYVAALRAAHVQRGGLPSGGVDPGGTTQVETLLRKAAKAARESAARERTEDLRVAAEARLRKYDERRRKADDRKRRAEVWRRPQEARALERSRVRQEARARADEIERIAEEVARERMRLAREEARVVRERAEAATAANEATLAALRSATQRLGTAQPHPAPLIIPSDGGSACCAICGFLACTGGHDR